MNVLKAAALTLVLGLCALGMTAGAAKAQIDPLFQAGDSWHGFSWNPGNTAMQEARLAVWSAGGGAFQGGLQLFGRGRAVSGRFTMDGSVDIVEINSTAPITLHGHTVRAADGSVSGLFSMAQGGRNLGPARLLRLFGAVDATVTGAVPPDPYFPPGPCYVGSILSGATGLATRSTLTFNPASTASSDRPQPSDRTGSLLLGDVSYTFVLSIDGHVLPDGGFKFDMIAHSTGAVVPCIRVSGELLPAVRVGDTQRFVGSYESVNTSMEVIDRGTFNVAAN